MQIVLSRPNDDKEIVDAYLVSHDSKNVGSFQTRWNKAVASAKKTNPEAWDVSEVIDDLRSDGWQIIRLDTSSVTY